MIAAFETVHVPSEQIRGIYECAKSDLDIYWPTYLAWAKAKDKVFEDEEGARRAQRREASKRRDAAVEAYTNEMDAWRAGSFFFRGPRPKCPPLDWECDIFFYASFGFPYCVDQAKKLQEEIAIMIDATVKSDEIQLSQAQFKRLQAFERGDVLREIKRMVEA